MPTSRPKRIVFDFGGVLFRWRPAELVRRVWPQHAERADHWVQQVFQGYGGDWGEFDRGTVQPAELARRIAARTGLHEAELHQLIDAVPDELTPVPETVDLLEGLHADGVALHFLSNMPAPYARHLVAHHAFLGRFLSGVFSCDLLLAKPDPRIYHEAARRFGADPAELVFLDDHAPNVAAALAAGWQALQFHDAAQAGRALKQAGWWPAA